MKHILTTALAAVMLFSHGGVAAQDQPGEAADFLDAIRDQLARAERGDTGLADQISACLTPDEAAPSDLSVTAAVLIGADGRPTGTARMDNPAPGGADMDHLRRFLALEAALIECSPYRLDNGATITSTRLVATADGARIRMAETRLFDFDAAADANTEAALSLSRNDWREIQQRLELAGFELGRPDGIFGPRSRKALSEWQKSNDLAVSGYLDEAQVDRLKAQTEQAFAEWQRSRRPAANTPRQPQRYRGADGCMRYPNGRIIPGQGLICDAKGMVQF